jgi:hypothetical protein
MRIVLNLPDELIRQINAVPEIDEFVQPIRINYRDPGKRDMVNSIDLGSLLIELHTLIREAVGSPASSSQAIQELVRRYGKAGGTMYGVPLSDLTREELIAVINFQHRNVI